MLIGGAVRGDREGWRALYKVEARRRLHGRDCRVAGHNWRIQQDRLVFGSVRKTCIQDPRVLVHVHRLFEWHFDANGFRRFHQEAINFVKFGGPVDYLKVLRPEKSLAIEDCMR